MAMRAGVAGLMAAALGAACGIYLWNTANLPPPGLHSSADAAPAGSAEPAAARLAPAAPAGQAGQDMPTHCAAPAALFPAPGLPASAALNPAIARQAYTAPHTLMARLQSEPEAGIALYTMLRHCASVPDRDAGPGAAAPSPTCPAIATDRLVRHDPVELLQQAASLGSHAARLRFVAEAPAVAEEFQQSGTSEGLAYAQELMAAAEQYGIQAAREGSPEAMRFLSAAYAAGKLGPVNLQRAYLYALPLQSLGGEADQRRLADLGARLSDAERRSAQTQAFGCAPAASGSALSSPFR